MSGVKNLSRIFPVLFIGIFGGMFCDSGRPEAPPSAGSTSFTGTAETKNFAVPGIPFAPRTSICRRTSETLHIDGRLDEKSWREAEWTDDFVDIQGNLKPRPPLRTRIKMLWDDRYFYVAAELEEPHVWANLTERDSIIFYDNDFEIFIDPDGDSHRYYELEINALGTVWDLFLDRPYRDGGLALHSWDIQGLRTAVHVEGTINNSSDTDHGWTVEIAMPWEVLKECADERESPREGEVWRVNCSRVEWRTVVVDGVYQKSVDAGTGKPLPEDNWVWSPQGLINMHYPEMWGYVLFSGSSASARESGDREKKEILPFGGNTGDEPVKWLLRRIYYAQQNFYLQYGRYSEDLTSLYPDSADRPAGFGWPPVIEATRDLFQARFESEDGVTSWNIDQHGRLWKLPEKED